MDALETDEQYDTFWYFHLNPFKRHALQIRGDGRVQVISREGDFEEPRTSSGWHAESNWHVRHCNCFTVDIFCRSEESHFMRRLQMLPDVPQQVWYAYHANMHYALLVWAGRLSPRDVQNTLNSSERERAPLQGHARDRAPQHQADLAPFDPFPQAGPAPHHSPFPVFVPMARNGGRAAPRSPSESPPRDNGAPAPGFQVFSGRPFRL